MSKKLYTILCLTVFLFLGSCQKEDTEGTIQEARTKMQTGAFKEAVSLLNGVIKADDSNAEALNMRGVAKVNMKEFAEAIADFDKAIASDNANYKYYYNRGNVKRSINKPNDAIADYTTALGLDSTQHQVWLNRALCYTATDKLLKALGDFSSAMRNGGQSDPITNFYYGKLFMTLESYKSAVEAFETCVSIDNEHAEGHYMLGLAQLGADMPKAEACQHLDMAVTLGYEEAHHAIEKYCQ